ncbi:hypothetical protein AB835_01630 [Candidatus Endobugula sertula]|uniref:Glycosyl transferase family 1 domain-containing protein n=1 Tax=Candidatus Endobugula sertula TaxID=62101 RepID=A0A1D2QT72_9GAMM|nr:hypothetical protein AB835_01630 [Candidatus Endobugula sertula]
MSNEISPNHQTPTIIYVVSQYPAISHTFILSEVNGLQSGGIRVQVASINQPDRPFEHLTNIEQQAYKETVFVKVALKTRFLFYIFKSLIISPKGFFKSLGTTLKAAARYPHTLLHQLAYWLEAMVVADMVHSNGCQQLHAHFSTQGCTVAMLAAELTGIEFSFTVHGPDEFYHVDTQQLPQKFAAANFIICISDFAKSQVMKYTHFNDWDKLYINNLGVDSSLFHPTEKNNTIPKLLCVGRLVNAKGQGVLVQAAKKLVERKIEFEVNFVGDGPDLENLQAFVKQNALNNQVKFSGKVNHDQVQQLQRQADIFVLPSFAEGIPIVLMEAMASGTPCVTTHITGIPELFTHDVNGLLVRPGNSTMLADALELLINDKQRASQLAEQALHTVRHQWCLHKSNQRLTQLFKRLLATPSTLP